MRTVTLSFTEGCYVVVLRRDGKAEACIAFWSWPDAADAMRAWVKRG